MHGPGKEKLADYVSRVIKQKHLKLRDVERRAGGEITNGYISGIINGRIENVSLDKLKALAKGLEVDAHELFDAATGSTQQLTDPVPSYKSPDVLWLLQIMQEVVSNSELVKIIHELVEMSSKEREVVARVTESIMKSKRPSRPSSRKRAKRKALEFEQETLILRASIGVQDRIESLLRKERTAKLTQAEKEELKQYEEMDDYLSLLNRLNRNVEQSRKSQGIASAS